MKKISGLFIVLLMFATLTANGNATFAEADPDQVIVKFKEGAQPDIAAADTAAVSQNGQTTTAALEVPPGKTAEAFMAELKARGDVEFVEPDYRIELAYTPNDPDFSVLQYH